MTITLPQSFDHFNDDVVRSQFLQPTPEVTDVARINLFDSVYEGFEKIKENVKRKIYNDKDLDLPEIQFEDKTSLANTSDKGVDHRFEMDWGGRERDYILHVPPGYDGTKAMPLVVVLHGMGQNADYIADLTKMSEKADREGFIVAYPNATKWLGVQKLQAWDVDNGLIPPGTDSDDVGFIRNMIATVQDKMSVDKDRIYATGFSNGGMMSYKLASDLSDTLAAVAVVSGGSDGSENPQQQGKVSVMTIHGTRDGIIPFFGLPSGSALKAAMAIPHFESVKESFQNLKARYGIEGRPEINDEGSNIRITSLVPDSTTELRAHVIKGGHHEWPGSDRAKQNRPGSNEAEFNATDTIWDFFRSHPKDHTVLPGLSTETILAV